VVLIEDIATSGHTWAFAQASLHFAQASEIVAFVKILDLMTVA